MSHASKWHTDVSSVRQHVTASISWLLAACEILMHIRYFRKIQNNYENMVHAAGSYRWLRPLFVCT